MYKTMSLKLLVFTFFLIGSFTYCTSNPASAPYTSDYETNKTSVENPSDESKTTESLQPYLPGLLKEQDGKDMSFLHLALRRRKRIIKENINGEVKVLCLYTKEKIPDEEIKECKLHINDYMWRLHNGNGPSYPCDIDNDTFQDLFECLYMKENADDEENKLESPFYIAIVRPYYSDKTYSQKRDMGFTYYQTYKKNGGNSKKSGILKQPRFTRYYFEDIDQLTIYADKPNIHNILHN